MKCTRFDQAVMLCDPPHYPKRGEHDWLIALVLIIIGISVLAMKAIGPDDGP